MTTDERREIERAMQKWNSMTRAQRAAALAAARTACPADAMRNLSYEIPGAKPPNEPMTSGGLRRSM